MVFDPEQSLDDPPIETKFKELEIPYTPQRIVQARETVKQMLLEERPVKVLRKYVTETEFEDITRKIAG